MEIRTGALRSPTWTRTRNPSITSRSAVASSPATKKAIEVGRQKLSDSLNTQPRLEPMPPIDDETQVFVPRDQLRR
jgi:hypothetical protein